MSLYRFCNIVIKGFIPFFLSLTAPHCCTGHSSPSHPSLEQSQVTVQVMRVTYQSSPQAKQRCWDISDVCSGGAKLSGVTDVTLLLPMSWQKRGGRRKNRWKNGEGEGQREETTQKHKIMLSMHESQRRLNSLFNFFWFNTHIRRLFNPTIHF